MRNPDAKRVMARLALTYERLAKFAALHEAGDRCTPPSEGRNESSKPATGEVSWGAPNTPKSGAQT
jgi:hypothetical protein